MSGDEIRAGRRPPPIASDIDKLRFLADWFDVRDEASGSSDNREVQADLRRIAAEHETLLTEVGMAMRMHQVQFDRANRIEVERDAALAEGARLKADWDAGLAVLAAVRKALRAGGQTAAIRCHAAWVALDAFSEGKKL